ncbi:hypothetical protein CEXT_583321 [Caerostris extrusa]|uniref:Uncharacterized protein n=1 Tax=Caerostris extrusa TaxID=172846 RepID=A0AAV4UXY3_CAEEX|nr:hypothetical protein CEXT_583321 [Caerostris extrusa]
MNKSMLSSMAPPGLYRHGCANVLSTMVAAMHAQKKYCKKLPSIPYDNVHVKSSPFNKMSPSATNKGNFQPIDSAVKVLAKQRRRVINNSFESITLQCFVGKTSRGHQRSRWTGAGRQRVK